MQKRNYYLVKPRIAVLILVVFIIVQSRQSLFSVKNQLTTIYHNIGQPAAWRGAAFFSKEFADLVAFLNQEIPANATVILPPRGIGFFPLTRTQYMQYFLYPRKIVNCNSNYNACMQGFMDEDNTYVVIAEAEQRSAFLAEQPSQRVRMFTPEYGLLVPASTLPGGGQALQIYPSLIDVGLAVFWSVLFLGGLGVAGGLVLEAFLPELKPLQVFGFGFGIGSGSFSILLTFPLLAGWHLNAAIIFGVYFLLLLLSVTLYLQKTRFSRVPGFLSFHEFKQESGLLPVLVLAVIMVILSFGLGYHRDDAVGIWAPKGYGIASAGFPDGPTHWGTLTIEYPLHIPVLIAAMRTIFSENLPESKLIFPFYATSTLVIVYSYFREKTSAGIAGLSALLIGTTPIFFNQSYIAYANLPAAYFFIAGVLFWQRSTESQGHPSSLQLAGGAFIAFSAWTRPEIIQIGVLITIWFICSRLRHRLSLMDVIRIASPVAGYLIFWLITKQVAYVKSGFVSGVFNDFLVGLLNGQLNLSSLYLVLRFAGREFLSIDIWGMVGWSALFGIAGLLLYKRRYAGCLPAHLVIAFLYILAILGGYYLTSFNTTHQHTVDWWLKSGLTRMSIPGVLLLWMVIARDVLALGMQCPDSQDRF
jgi:hypothetical protein